MNRLLPFTLSLALLAPLSNAGAAPAKPTPKPPAKPTPKPKPKPTPKPVPRPVPPTGGNTGTTTPVAPPPVAPPSEAPPPVPVATGPKTWVLLVGVGHYQNPQINSLRYPAVDASSLRDALVDPNIGALPHNQVMLLADEDATQEKIMGAVDSFFKPNVKKGDKVVVFLAGHGVSKGAGLSAESYLLPTDVKGLSVQALQSSAVPMMTLSENLGTLPASQFMLFVDACREDPTPGRGVKGNSLSDILARNVSVVPEDESAESATFFACSIGERAFEDAQYGHGVFTNWILQALKAGTVAQKGDGSVDFGILSSYVTKKVEDWAKETSANGEFEVTQTPELIARTPIKNPLIVLKSKRTTAGTPAVPAPPRIVLVASPSTAQIKINGALAGVGSVEKDLPAAGTYTIDISADGYTSVSNSIDVQGGYEHQLTFQLEPATGANAGGPANPAPNSQAVDFYNRAVAAEERGQWEVAEQGYAAAIAADPKFGAAYEALAELHRMQNRNTDTIADMLGLVANTPRTAHTLSLLSRAYSQFAMKDAGEGNTSNAAPKLKDYTLPKKPDDAAKQAVKAAKDALAVGAQSPEANLAQGYALSAGDKKGKNKTDALAAFGKAVLYDPTNAAAHLGMGYGIRFYAMQNDKQDKRESELNRAVNTLKEAVKLRPNYYEAHRELAFCYMGLNDTEAALAECRLARSNRGGASDNQELASIELAMSGLHEQVAQKSSGQKKEDNEAASQGYLSDAKETAKGKDLKIALSILSSAGVSTSLSSYLPSEVQKWLDPEQAIQGEINKARGGLGIPGNFPIPGLGR